MRNTKKKAAELFKGAHISTIFDFCCGMGGQGVQYHAANLKSYELDNNWKLLSYASRIHPGIIFICADAGHVPIPDSTFNGISFIFALHDKPVQLRNRMISEARRLLKVGGKAVFIDYTLPWNFWSRIGYFITYLIEIVSGHFFNGISFLSDGGLMPFLQRNGFVIINKSKITWRSSVIIFAELSHK